MTWISELAKKERKRRVWLAAFKNAMPSFLESLVAQLRTDIEAFSKEFPSEEVGVLNDRESGGIIIANSAHAESPTAKIVLESGRGTISCSFENTGSDYFGWEDGLSPINGELCLEGVDLSYTVESLSRKILIPVLFPGLSHDPSTRDALK